MNSLSKRIFRIRIGKFPEEYSFPILFQKHMWKETDAYLVKDTLERNMKHTPALTITHVKSNTIDFTSIRRKLYIPLRYVVDVLVTRQDDGTFEEIVTKEKIALLRYGPHESGKNVYALSGSGGPFDVRRPFVIDAEGIATAEIQVPPSEYESYKKMILLERGRLFGSGALGPAATAATAAPAVPVPEKMPLPELQQGKNILTRLMEKSAETAIKIVTLPESIMATYAKRLKELDLRVVEMQKTGEQIETDMQTQTVRPVLEPDHPAAILHEYEELLRDVAEIDSIHDNKDIARFVKEKLSRFDAQQPPKTALKLIHYYGMLIDSIADDVNFIYLRDLNLMLMDQLYQVIVSMDDPIEISMVVGGLLSESHINIIASKIEPLMEQGIEEIQTKDYYQFKHHFNEASPEAKKELLNRILQAMVQHRKNREMASGHW